MGFFFNAQIKGRMDFTISTDCHTVLFTLKHLLFLFFCFLITFYFIFFVNYYWTYCISLFFALFNVSFYVARGIFLAAATKLIAPQGLIKSPIYPSIHTYIQD